MEFWYGSAGFLGGILGGMGMGGGTLLIPILTVFLNVEQQKAQCINLLAFVPMSVVALILHFKNRLVETKGLAFVLVPAVLSAVVSSFIAVGAPNEILKKLFGGFLVVLAVFGICNSLLKSKTQC